MTKILGYERSAGKIEDSGFSWDNILIHCLVDDVMPDFHGVKTSVLKIKSDFIPRIFGCPIEQLDSFVGKEVITSYVPNGNKAELVSVKIAK